MKRFFCFLLALIWVFAFAACSNWSVEIKEPEDLSTNAEEPEDLSTGAVPCTEEETKAFYSAGGDRAFLEEAASVLSGYDFSEIKGLESPVLLKQAVYSALSKIGASGDFETSCKITPQKFLELLERRFGEGCLSESYDPGEEEIEIFNDPSLKRWELVSVNKISVSGNLITYTLKIALPDKTEYQTKMSFEAMKDGEETFLRLVSNEFLGSGREFSLERRAEALAEQLVGVLSGKDLDGTMSLDENQQLCFILRTYMYSPAGEFMNEASPYFKSFPVGPDGWVHFPEEEISRVAFELFGSEDFAFAPDDNFIFDCEKGEYLSALEFGLESAFSCWGHQPIAKRISDDEIAVDFLLTDSLAYQWEPGWNCIGMYRMVFSVMEGEKGEYLRFKSFEPLGKTTEELEAARLGFEYPYDWLPEVNYSEALPKIYADGVTLRPEGLDRLIYYAGRLSDFEYPWLKNQEIINACLNLLVFAADEREVYREFEDTISISSLVISKEWVERAAKDLFGEDVSVTPSSEKKAWEYYERAGVYALGIGPWGPYLLPYISSVEETGGGYAVTVSYFEGDLAGFGVYYDENGNSVSVAGEDGVPSLNPYDYPEIADLIENRLLKYSVEVKTGENGKLYIASVKLKA